MADIVFIHGLWISYTSWQPWIAHLETNGYRGIAPRWLGEGESATESRENPSAQAGYGTDALTRHVSAVIEQFDTSTRDLLP